MDPPGSLECVPEPDPWSSHDNRTELEMASPRGKVSNERGGLAIPEAARLDEESQEDGDTSADASPSAPEKKRADGKTKVGQGLESIGDLTADALHRVASAVGSVAKAPAIVLANVGGGLCPNANSPLPPAEHRSRNAEMTELAMELNLSPRSHPITDPRSMEKLRTARSLLQETETKGTLVERVQILEDRFTEYMENNDKTLSIIRSKLALIFDSRGKLRPGSESLAAAELLPESPSGEEFHDADQGSGNLESLQTLDQKSFEEDGVRSECVHGEARRNCNSPTLVREPLADTPTPELPESAQGDHDHAGKSATVPSSLEPQFRENAAAGKTDSALAGAGDSPLTSAVMGEPHQNDTVGAGMEDKHMQRESEYKAAEDMNFVPDEKPGSFTSFVMEPKPLAGQRAKKKKEKKEKKQDNVAGEKDKKHSSRAEEESHDGVAKEKGIRNNFLRTEEKSKQPFKHLRNKLRRAFKSK